MSKELFLIRGLPGSGKTTFAKKMAKRRFFQNYPVWEADEYFVNDDNGKYEFNPSYLREAHRWCKDRCIYSMSKKVNKIFISNTFTEEWEMVVYFELAKQYGYNVTTIIVENRHDGVNIHGVDEKKLEVMKKRFQIKL